MRRLILGLAIISVCGCATAHPPAVLLPEANERTEVFFSNGIPFSWITLDCASILLALEQVHIGSIPYFRVYCLYRNSLPDSFLLYPHETFTLSRAGSKEAEEPVRPVMPSEMQSEITRGKIGLQVAQIAAGIAQVMTLRPTTITAPNGQTWKVDDLQMKSSLIATSTANDVADTEMNAEALQHKVASGILRRSTIFPGQQVGGYVYFAPPSGRSRSGSVYHKPLSVDETYVLSMNCPCGPVQIVFTSIPGE